MKKISLIQKMFQSTLLRKERQGELITNQGFRMFQSTLLRKERLGLHQINFGDEDVSIHAPTKGATQIDANNKRYENGFNPRSYERSDQEGPLQADNI